MPEELAIVVPMANEAAGFEPFTTRLAQVLNGLGKCRAYLVVDKASTDNTLLLCKALSLRDQRFTTIYEPANRNVVDAYIRGYREAYNNGHALIIEMDAGLSHDPGALPAFVKVLQGGCDCAFGSRFIKGGSMGNAGLQRRLLSKLGTMACNGLLGTRLHDMTSGYQGFSREVVGQFLNYPLRSKAHFYQSELRYLLRRKKHAEVPIHYSSPSPRVSLNAILNALKVLFYYFCRRLYFNAAIIH